MGILGVGGQPVPKLGLLTEANMSMKEIQVAVPDVAWLVACNPRGQASSWGPSQPRASQESGLCLSQHWDGWHLPDTRLFRQDS